VQEELRLSFSDLMYCFASLDIRVGQVTSVHGVVDAERLFCCQVDLGSSKNAQQLVQGLAVAVQQRVFVFCNILPRELHGVQSQGGLLVAYYADGHCEAVQPPSGLPLGAPVASSTQLPPPVDLSFVGNVWHQCCCHLSVASDGTLLLAGMPLLVSGLHCTVRAGQARPMGLCWRGKDGAAREIQPAARPPNGHEGRWERHGRACGRCHRKVPP